jgi:hypothetical protein
MRARVNRHNLRHKDEAVPAIERSAAEIHIFKPYRPEMFCESSDLFPNRPPDHEQRTGRLLYRLQYVVVQRQATISAIHRIGRPEPI